MSQDIFKAPGLTVTSFCGPADTLERTRMRLQFNAATTWPTNTLGYNEVRELSIALDRWLVEHNK